MSVPPELVPHCPVCGRPMAMNLRSDDTFVEDEGWQAAEANPRATYACVNLGEAVAPAAIERRSVLVDGDIAATLRALLAP